MNTIENFFTTIQQSKIYIRTPNPTISEDVQKLLFSLGYHWIGRNINPKYTYNKYVVVYRNQPNLFTNNYDDTDAYFMEASIFFKIAKSLHLKNYIKDTYEYYRITIYTYIQM